MKKTFILLALLTLGITAMAQTNVRYGTIHYDSILTSMPEYAKAQQALDTLKAQYTRETEHNEIAFKRQFAEFLEGQKNFPEVILLKRQRDLQESLEKGVAWRTEADKLLLRAKEALFAPVHKKLKAAIQKVGIDRGYETIVNLDSPTLPFLHPSVTEDATPYILSEL